jgi:DNA polymerase III alpha subunit
MNFDKYGQCYTTTDELCDLLYKNPSIDLTRFFVQDPAQYNRSIKDLYAELPKLHPYLAVDISAEEYHTGLQKNWHMPLEYQKLDIVEHILTQCKTEEELQRVGQELILYQERGLFDLLRFMKYLVDTLRKNNLVWGVGRGSSVASYVLYLLGVHKINSIYYDLDIAEFLK